MRMFLLGVATTVLLFDSVRAETMSAVCDLTVNGNVYISPEEPCTVDYSEGAVSIFSTGERKFSIYIHRAGNKRSEWMAEVRDGEDIMIGTFLEPERDKKNPECWQISKALNGRVCAHSKRQVRSMQ